MQHFYFVLLQRLRTSVKKKLGKKTGEAHVNLAHHSWKALCFACVNFFPVLIGDQLSQDVLERFSLFSLNSRYLIGWSTPKKNRRSWKVAGKLVLGGEKSNFILLKHKFCFNRRPRRAVLHSLWFNSCLLCQREVDRVHYITPVFVASEMASKE